MYNDAQLQERLRQDMDAIRWPDGCRQRLLREVRGGEPVKAKLSLGAVMTAVLLVLTLTVAIGITHEENGEIMPLSQQIVRLENQSYVIQGEGDYPSAVAVIGDTYYDGQNLYYYYKIEGEPNVVIRATEGQEQALRDAVNSVDDLADLKTVADVPGPWKVESYFWILDPNVEWDAYYEIYPKLQVQKSMLPSTGYFVEYDENGFQGEHQVFLHETLRDQDAVTIYVPVGKMVQTVERDENGDTTYSSVIDYIDMPRIAITISRNEKNDQIAWKQTWLHGVNGAKEIKRDTVCQILEKDGWGEATFTLLDASYDGERIMLQFTLEGEPQLVLNEPLDEAVEMSGAAERYLYWSFPEQPLVENGADSAAYRYWAIHPVLQTENWAYTAPWYDVDFERNEEGVYTFTYDLKTEPKAGEYPLLTAKELDWYDQEFITISLVVAQIKDVAAANENGLIQYGTVMNTEGTPRLRITLSQVTDE